MLHCANYIVKSITLVLSNHKILPRQFCVVCRFYPTIHALVFQSPSADFFRLFCSVHLPQKVRRIFGLKMQKNGPGTVSTTIPKPVFSDFTVFRAISAKKLPDLSDRQIRQFICRSPTKRCISKVSQIKSTSVQIRFRQAYICVSALRSIVYTIRIVPVWVLMNNYSACSVGLSFRFYKSTVQRTLHQLTLFHDNLDIPYRIRRTYCGSNPLTYS